MKKRTIVFVRYWHGVCEGGYMCVKGSSRVGMRRCFLVFGLGRLCEKEVCYKQVTVLELWMFWRVWTRARHK